MFGVLKRLRRENRLLNTEVRALKELLVNREMELAARDVVISQKTVLGTRYKKRNQRLRDENNGLKARLRKVKENDLVISSLQLIMSVVKGNPHEITSDFYLRREAADRALRQVIDDAVSPVVDRGRSVSMAKLLDGADQANAFNNDSFNREGEA